MGRKIFSWAASLSIMVMSPLGVWAQETDWRNGKFGHLVPFIDTYDYAGVLTDSQVEPLIKRYLGSEYRHLLQNLVVQGRVEGVDGYLLLRGGKPHETNEENASVAIGLKDGTVTAVIFSSGTFTLYDDGMRGYASLPAQVKIRMAEQRYPEIDSYLGSDLPPGLTLKGRSGGAP